MSFLVSLLLAYQPVKALGNLNISIQEGLAGAERIFELLDTPNKNSEDLTKKDNQILNGNINFEKVSFSYENEKVLKEINLNIPAGKKVAIVGLSGSGKSTIVHLLMRFFINYSGKISIDNKNIENIPLFDLRENISLITQETFLFNESIFDNIKYGNLSATSDEIFKIADLTGISKFANTMPNKLDTIVGESGIKLSGGQRQRIALARALLKNSPILIMDEATSSLDNITEKQIITSIDEMMKNKTTLIITHRLSTIKDADVIYTLDKGIIESHGKHEELLKKSNIYKKLQIKENLENEI